MSLSVRGARVIMSPPFAATGMPIDPETRAQNRQPFHSKGFGRGVDLRGGQDAALDVEGTHGSRSRGSWREHAPAATDTTPPTTMVRGAPKRSASTPASRLPNGAVPKNAIV